MCDTHFSLTLKSYNPFNEDYDHDTILERETFLGMVDTVKALDPDSRHHYYVTEHDNADNDITEQQNADEWLIDAQKAVVA